MSSSYWIPKLRKFLLALATCTMILPNLLSASSVMYVSAARVQVDGNRTNISRSNISSQSRDVLPYAESVVASSAPIASLSSVESASSPNTEPCPNCLPCTLVTSPYAYLYALVDFIIHTFHGVPLDSSDSYTLTESLLENRLTQNLPFDCTTSQTMVPKIALENEVLVQFIGETQGNHWYNFTPVGLAMAGHTAHIDGVYAYMPDILDEAYDAYLREFGTDRITVQNVLAQDAISQTIFAESLGLDSVDLPLLGRPEGQVKYSHLFNDSAGSGDAFVSDLYRLLVKSKANQLYATLTSNSTDQVYRERLAVLNAERTALGNLDGVYWASLPTVGLSNTVSSPSFLAADVNADGLSDLILLGRDSTGLHISTQISTGDGNWESYNQDFAYDDPYSQAMVGDLNSDGRSDVLLMSKHPNPDGTTDSVIWNVDTLMAQSDNTWSYLSGLITAPSLVEDYPILSGDVDGDKRSDLILVGQNPDETGLNVLTSFLNNDGTWRPISQVLGDGGRVHDHPTLVGDVDGDGRTDLIFVGQDWDGPGLSIRTKFSKGDGTWQPVTQVLGDGAHVHDHPTLVGDVDGDSRSDIIFVSQDSDGASFNIHTKFSNGDGTWRSATQAMSDPPGVYDHPTMVGDVNGDGLSDLVFLGGYKKFGGELRVLVLLSKGDGSWFPAHQTIDDGPVLTDQQDEVRTTSVLIGRINGHSQARSDLIFAASIEAEQVVKVRVKFSVPLTDQIQETEAHSQADAIVRSNAQRDAEAAAAQARARVTARFLLPARDQLIKLAIGAAQNNRVLRNRILDTQSLGDYLFVDLLTEDSSTATSRFTFASESLQAAVRAYLLGNNPYFSLIVSDLTAWKTYETYNFWKAAMMARLYPEDLLIPELGQAGRTASFKRTVENFDAAPSGEAAETEYRRYVQEVDSFRRHGRIAGAKIGELIYYFTTSDSGGLYFSTLNESGQWSSWTPINSNTPTRLESETYVTKVIATRDRLFIFLNTGVRDTVMVVDLDGYVLDSALELPNNLYLKVFTAGGIYATNEVLLLPDLKWSNKAYLITSEGSQSYHLKQSAGEVHLAGGSSIQIVAVASRPGDGEHLFAAEHTGTNVAIAEVDEACLRTIFVDSSETCSLTMDGLDGNPVAVMDLGAINENSVEMRTDYYRDFVLSYTAQDSSPLQWKLAHVIGADQEWSDEQYSSENVPDNLTGLLYDIQIGASSVVAVISDFNRGDFVARLPLGSSESGTVVGQLTLGSQTRGLSEFDLGSIMTKAGSIEYENIQKQYFRSMTSPGFARRYLEESFLHIPLFFAAKLNEEGRFEDAARWYRVVFDPYRDRNLPGCGFVYQVADICSSASISTANSLYEFVGDTAAELRAGIDPYQLAELQPQVYGRYAQLKQAENLLDWADAEFIQDTLESVSSARDLYTTAAAILSRFDSSPDTCLSTNPLHDSCVPPNPLLDILRQRVDFNLSKIRSGRNYAGIPRLLDPVNAALGPSTVSEPPPAFRYQFLLERSRRLAQYAKESEAYLLSVMEKQDAANYSLLQAKRDLSLLRTQIAIQATKVDAANEQIVLAHLQSATAAQSVVHFDTLIRNGESVDERGAVDAMKSAIGNQEEAIGWLQMFVNDTNQDSPYYLGQSSAALASGQANYNQMVANSSLTMESYARREEEWKYQKSLAEENQQVADASVTLFTLDSQIAQQEYDASLLSENLAEDTLDFLASGQNVSSSLYNWMKAELRKLYRQQLNMAVSSAQATQRALAFELQEPLNFIVANYWVSEHDGMLSAEKLVQDLERLEQFRIEHDERRQEITKYISLAQIMPSEFEHFRQTGDLQFTTLMSWFDRDFPGQYLRMIKTVDLQVVALIPPIDGIHATLTNLGISRIMVGPPWGESTILHRPPATISLSAPQQTSGLFQLQLDDPMLLPFEGSGVETMWNLEMPRGANRLDYRTIVDVLMTIRYTARQDPTYREIVLSQLKTGVQERTFFGIRDSFPDTWYSFHNPRFLADTAKYDESTGSPAPYTFYFHVDPTYFPPNDEDISLTQVTLATDPALAFDVPVRLNFTPQNAVTSVLMDGSIISGTLKLDAGLSGQLPFGAWRVAVDVAACAGYDTVADHRYAAFCQHVHASQDSADKQWRMADTSWLQNMLIIFDYNARLEYPQP